MEENKLYRKSPDEESDSKYRIYVYDPNSDWIPISYLEEVTPPESLNELEEKVKELWEPLPSPEPEFNKGHRLGVVRTWNLIEPLISSMLQGKDEEHKMLGNYDSGYSAAEYGIIKFINEWNHGETNSHMGQILEDKFGSQISSLQAQLQSKEDSLTHWRNEGYHAREELYKAKERIKQLEAELKKVQEAASQHDYMRGEQEKIITELRKKSRR